MANEYIYAVARVRGKEQTLLSGSFMETLMAAKDYGECLRLLADKGWNTEGVSDPEELFTAERKRTWDFVGELVDDLHVFDVFLYANDYHNLKAAIKETISPQAYEVAYMAKSQCTVDPLLIRNAVKERNFDALPDAMKEVAKEAMDVLLHTGDGQACDIIVDKAALSRIYEAGKASRNEILSLYGELTVASANIKTAIRAAKTRKDQAFLEKALAPCDTLDVKELARAATEGEESVYAYLEKTKYSDAVSEIKESPSAFEKWCDDQIIESMRPQIHNPFTLSPIAAFILARENEIKSVRIVISGKINGLSDDSVRERVREMYV